MHVAICDDEIIVLESLKKQLEKQKLVRSVQIFSNIETFQKEIENQCLFD